jgi:hypothetical protein
VVGVKRNPATSQPPSITIVVRTQGKREDGIARLTNSFKKIIAQNLSLDISLLFVTDNPEFRINNAQEKISIRHISGAPRGDTRCFLLWSSFNLIVGDYAIFLDDDDLLAERDWSALAEIFVNASPDLVFIPVNLTLNSSPGERLMTSNRLVAISLGKRNFVAISGVVYRASLLRALPTQRLNSFGAFFAEDHILMRMAVSASSSLAFCKTDVSAVNLRSNSVPLSPSEISLWKNHDTAIEEFSDLISPPGFRRKRMRVILTCAVPLGLYFFSIINFGSLRMLVKLKRQSWRAY